jgi:nucleoside-diphosphate-sugar epimerase
MNIIVTGANGYIGRNVVRGLLDKGHQVTAMLFDGETPHHFLEGASLFYGNIFALSQDKKCDLVKDAECLLHLAWQAGFNHRDPSHLANVMKHFLS